MDFISATERKLGSDFLRDGYVIVPAEDQAGLDRIQEAIAAEAAAFLGTRTGEDATAFLNTIASSVSTDRLNDLRVTVISKLSAQPWVRPAYFQTAQHTLEALVGNELVMQRNLSLSVQLPNDDSSLLPLHSDAWSEDSPFEVVLWIPFVDCFATKSMFVLSPEASRRWAARMHEFSDVEKLYEAVEPEATWLEIPYGHVLVFTHTLMHGNRINREPTTRWSMNVRFKSLFSPYSDKRLGDFFAPISIRPVTRVGMHYQMPEGFRE